MRPDWWEYIADEPAPEKAAKPVRYRRAKDEEPIAVTFARMGFPLSPLIFTAKEIAAAEAALEN